jgi:hypothetical protein
MAEKVKMVCDGLEIEEIELPEQGLPVSSVIPDGNGNQWAVVREPSDGRVEVIAHTHPANRKPVMR